MFIIILLKALLLRWTCTGYITCFPNNLCHHFTEQRKHFHIVLISTTN